MELKNTFSGIWPIFEDRRPGTESNQSFVQNPTAGAKRRVSHRVSKLKGSLATFHPHLFTLKV